MPGNRVTSSDFLVEGFVYPVNYITGFMVEDNFLSLKYGTTALFKVRQDVVDCLRNLH